MRILDQANAAAVPHCSQSWRTWLFQLPFWPSCPTLDLLNLALGGACSAKGLSLMEVAWPACHALAGLSMRHVPVTSHRFIT